MSKIALIQISGVDRTGKSTFLKKTLGVSTRTVHFAKPFSFNTPVGTIMSFADMLQHMSGHPAARDWINELQFWDRGLMDPYAYDGCRGNTFSETQYKAVYDASLAVLGPHVRQVFLVATDPISTTEKDALDAYYKPHQELLRERFLRATKLLRSWGAEVYQFRSFAESAPAVLVRDWVRKGETTGFCHKIRSNGTLNLSP